MSVINTYMYCTPTCEPHVQTLSEEDPEILEPCHTQFGD